MVNISWMFTETGYCLLERLRKVNNSSWSMPTLDKINTIQTFIFTALKAWFPCFFVILTVWPPSKPSNSLVTVSLFLSVCLSLSHTHIYSTHLPPHTHIQTYLLQALILMELRVSSSTKHDCLDWRQQHKSEQNPYLSFPSHVKSKSSVLSLSEQSADISIAPSHPGAISGNWGLLGKIPHSLSLVDFQKC